MMATWTLFRLQLRIMRWPVICVVGIFLVLILSPLGHSIEFDILTGLFLSVLVILSGALIFGVEYQEGARDYIRTRPVSAGMVYWTKTAVLFAISLPVAFLSDHVLNISKLIDIPRVSTLPVVWAVLFSFSMWLAQMTILFRDSIRGVLYGSLSFVLLGAMLVWGFKGWVIVPEFPLVWRDYTHGMMKFWYIRHLTFALGGVMLLPAVIVVTSQWIYQYVEGQIRWISPLALLVLFLVLAYGGFVFSCLHDNGKTSYHNFAGGREYDVVGMEQPVPWERADEKREFWGGILAQSLDGKDILAYKTSIDDHSTEFYTLSAATERKKDVLYRTMEVSNSLLYRCYPLEHAYVVISVAQMQGGKQRYSLVYLPYDPQGGQEARIYPVHVAREYIDEIRDFPDSTLSLIHQEGVHKNSEGNNILTEFNEVLDLKTGLITESTSEVDVSRENYKDEYYDPILGEIQLREAKWCENKNSCLPQYSIIPVPFRVINGYAKLYSGLFHFDIYWSCGVNSDTEDFLSRDDKFLIFFVVDRVAVWDMTQRDQPRFIGTAPVLPPLENSGLVIWNSHHITPIEREDGALGYLFQDRILWLEFPALMKETKS